MDFNKPLHIRPEIGRPPAFLDEGAQIVLGTSFLQKRCLDAVKNGKVSTKGAVEEYFIAYAAGLEKFRLGESALPFDERVIENIAQFIPYRNELVDVVLVIVQYGKFPDIVPAVLKMVEDFLNYFSDLRNDEIYDNFYFIIHEISLYIVAILIKHEEFEALSKILEGRFYFSNQQRGGFLVSVSQFRRSMRSLITRNERLDLRRISIRADLLKDRANLIWLIFRDIMQADFVIFLRLAAVKDKWWPETLLYSRNSYTPFEIFTRSISSAYFERLAKALGVVNLAGFRELIVSLNFAENSIPHWEFEAISPPLLAGLDQLCTEN